MAPATIERAHLGDAVTQLSLDVLETVRAARLAPEARVIAPATAAARAAAAVVRAAAPAASAAAPLPAAPAGGTLDDLISGAWRQLGAQRVAACPICAEPMRAVAGTRSAECRSCGATLSA